MFGKPPETHLNTTVACRMNMLRFVSPHRTSDGNIKMFWQAAHKAAVFIIVWKLMDEEQVR